MKTPGDLERWREYPLPGTGSTGHLTLLASASLTARDVLVALPPGYSQEEVSYPVVYMHDGQNLFDPATSFAGDWGLVETLNALTAPDRKPIVVGIPNRGRQRRYEYSPFQDLLHGGGGGERYLQFIVESVKPLIDRSFRTRSELAHTVIAGSSLGGLISLYALYRHPDIFGAAAALSPALWFARRTMFRYLEQHGPERAGRIYLDVGTEEGAETLADVRRLRDLLLGTGYRLGEDLAYLEEEGGEHNEAAWGRRFKEALPWLLGSSLAPSP